jgi:hypothetical protein
MFFLSHDNFHRQALQLKATTSPQQTSMQKEWRKEDDDMIPWE